MSSVELFDGCYAPRREVGGPCLIAVGGGGGKTVPVGVWVFADGLIVTAVDGILTRLGPRAWKHVLNTDGVTAEALLDEYPKAVALHRDAVASIELRSGAWRKWARLAAACATFECTDGREFDLLVDRWRAREFASMLERIYGFRFRA